MQMIAIFFAVLGLHGSLGASEQKGRSEAEEFFAEVTLSTQEVEVPQHFVVTLDLGYPTGYEVNMQALQKALLSHSILSSPAWKLVSEETERQESGFRERVTFTLEPTVAGRFPLSFYRIEFRKGDQVVSLLSPLLYVTSSLPEELPQLSFSLAPPFSFSEGRQVKMSLSNREKWQGEGDAAKNQVLMEVRTISWRKLGGVLFVLVVSGGLFVWLARRVPEKKEKEDPLFVKEKRVEQLFSQIGNTRIRKLFCQEVNSLVRMVLMKVGKQRALSLSEGGKEELDFWLEKLDWASYSPSILSAEECTKAYKVACGLLVLTGIRGRDLKL